MRERIISIVKVVYYKGWFIDGTQGLRRQQGRGIGVEIGRGRRVGTGGGVDPTKRGVRISASSKGGPRRRRLSIFQGNQRENIVEK